MPLDPYASVPTEPAEGNGNGYKFSISPTVYHSEPQGGYTVGSAGVTVRVSPPESPSEHPKLYKLLRGELSGDLADLRRRLDAIAATLSAKSDESRSADAEIIERLTALDGRLKGVEGSLGLGDISDADLERSPRDYAVRFRGDDRERGGYLLLTRGRGGVALRGDIYVIGDDDLKMLKRTRLKYDYVELVGQPVNEILKYFGALPDGDR